VRNLAEGFDNWISHLEASEDINCVIVDLSSCVYMDSTFMGLLVKLARLLMHRSTLLIANASSSHRELLEGIGVMRGWKYVDRQVECSNWSSLCDALTGKLNVRLVVELHEGLVNWDEKNKKFIPFVELGKAELARREQMEEDDDED
jgi:ABC-type transporter Mla MlaB component